MMGPFHTSFVNLLSLFNVYVSESHTSLVGLIKGSFPESNTSHTHQSSWLRRKQQTAIHVAGRGFTVLRPYGFRSSKFLSSLFVFFYPFFSELVYHMRHCTKVTEKKSYIRIKTLYFYRLMTG